MYHKELKQMLERASLDELRSKRADEMQKPSHSKSKMFIDAIDEELRRREGDVFGADGDRA